MADLVQDAEVDFDDPTYMRIADVQSLPPEQTAMMKSAAIYFEIDDLNNYIE